MVLYAQFVLGYYSSCFSLVGETNSLGLSFGYSYLDVLHFFELRTKQQLLCYSQFLAIWDTLFPIIYTTMYVSWIIYLFKKWIYLSIIPLLHMITDWIENYLEISFLNEYLKIGELSDSLVSIGSMITSTKWILSILTYVILIFGIITKLRVNRSKKLINNRGRLER